MTSFAKITTLAFITTARHGLWLSLVERCVRDAEVAGSNPVSPAILLFFKRDGFRIEPFGKYVEGLSPYWD